MSIKNSFCLEVSTKCLSCDNRYRFFDIVLHVYKETERGREKGEKREREMEGREGEREREMCVRERER